MNSLKKRMELREKVLEHLAEHTSLEVTTTIMGSQLAAIMNEPIEEIDSVLMALEDDGLIILTIESNMGLGAIISSKGQKRVHYGPAQVGHAIHNHFYAGVHAVQQGTGNVLNQQANVQNGVSQGIRELRHSTADRPANIRALISDQLLDLHDEMQEASPKVSRIFSALTTLLALAGDDPEVVEKVSQLGQLLKVEFPHE